MLRLIAFVFTCAPLLPIPAHALCDGTSITDFMDETSRAELSDRAESTPYGTGLYWSATKDDAIITIIGTMHLPDPRHDALLERALPRLQAADVLLVEATQDDQIALQTHMARNTDLMVITSGPTLPDLLDEPTWSAIREAAEARGVPGFMAAKMQPWFLSLTLSLPPCAMAAMASGDGGLDALLMREAAANDIPVAPLEGWQDTFALLSSGTFDEQIDALRMGLMPPVLQDAAIVSLIDSYFEGRTAFGWHLTHYMLEFMPLVDPDMFEDQIAQLEDLLLIQRNRAWIPVIETAARDHERVFIGFGAAHLIGEDGVLNLLAQNGWTVAHLP